MKTLIVITLVLAGTISYIDASKDDVTDYLCDGYSEDSGVYWVTCMGKGK